MDKERFHLNKHTSQRLKNKRVLCLIDGEHYPPVIKTCLQKLESGSVKIQGLFLIGGREKISGLEEVLGKEYNLILPQNNSDLSQQFEHIIQNNNIELVLDLSDEPVIDYKLRFQLASYSLKHNTAYIGGDFTFNPPEQKDILTKPSLSILGTGKRIGKTALGITIARILQDAEIKPTIICMGRGGPPNPKVIHADEIDVTVETLFDILEEGQHAASDYWEDAIFSGCKTIGCHRCGGGMAGNPIYSNVLEGAEIANDLAIDCIIAEGSGPTLPPLKTDKNITLISANQPVRKIFDYFGLYRIMIADLLILTMCEPHMSSQKKVQQIKEKLSDLKPNTEIIPIAFRPTPRGNIKGKRVFVATSAMDSTKEHIIDHLETEYNCKIQGYTNNLSNRTKLSRDLENGLKNSEVLLTEIKAAAIDTAAKKAMKMNIDVDFLHNSPKIIENKSNKLEELILSLYQSI